MTVVNERGILSLREGDSARIFGVQTTIIAGSLKVVKDSNSDDDNYIIADISSLDGYAKTEPAVISWLIYLFKRRSGGIYGDEIMFEQLMELMENGKMPECLIPFETEERNRGLVLVRKKQSIILDRDVNGRNRKGEIFWPENERERFCQIMDEVAREHGLLPSLN